MLYVSVDLALLSGWRHFYFLNFYILYYVRFSIFFIFEKYSKDELKKKIINLILAIFLTIQFFDIYQYHPFQSSYFNNLISKNIKKKFEIDTQSLSRTHAIKEILKIKSDKTLIGTASWTPLGCRSMINKDLWKKLAFLEPILKMPILFIVIIIMMLILILIKNIRCKKTFTCIKYFQLMVQNIFNL